MEWYYWVVLIVANTPVYAAIGWVMFDGFEGFFESLKYAIKPDILSWIQGEGIDDMWNELKLFGFVALCGLLVYGEYWVLAKYVLGG